MEERAPASFGKSLYFGHIAESLVVPYPTAARRGARERWRWCSKQFRKFATGEVDSRKIDEEARLPAAVLDGMKRLGLFGLAIPEAYGGLGLSVTGYARAMQEIAGVDGSIAVTARRAPVDRLQGPGALRRPTSRSGATCRGSPPAR